MLRHVVLIKFNPDVPKETREEVHNLYQKITEACGGKEAGILEFIVEWSLDKRTSDLVEIALFDSPEALGNFRTHKAHVELTNLLHTVANWWVGNFEV